MAATVRCGFPSQPCSPWSGPKTSTAMDRLLRATTLSPCSLPSPALLKPQFHLQLNGQVSKQMRGGRKDRL